MQSQWERCMLLPVVPCKWRNAINREQILGYYLRDRIKKHNNQLGDTHEIKDVIVWIRKIQLLQAYLPLGDRFRFGPRPPATGHGDVMARKMSWPPIKRLASRKMLYFAYACVVFGGHRSYEAGVGHMCVAYQIVGIGNTFLLILTQSWVGGLVLKLGRTQEWVNIWLS